MEGRENNEKNFQQHGPEVNGNRTINQADDMTHQNIANALSRLSIEKEKIDKESDEVCDQQSTPISTKEQTESGQSTKNEQVDSALVEAMRVPRDKAFVRKYEKEMEDQIRNLDVIQWELPLMNTYQRMLVHRIADHYGLGHSLDPTTKQVTLVKKESTHIPETLVSILAERERLSDPADFPPLFKSLSGQNTPANGSASTPSGSQAAVRIMRREGGSNASRSESFRNGSNTPEDGNSTRKDRKNMTMEEREAAYKEARQRIFGSEEAEETNSETTEPSNSGATTLDRRETRNIGSSRSTTPFSSASDVTPRKIASHDEHSNVSSSEFIPSQNASVNHQPSHYPYSNGAWPGVQVDAYGRQFQPQAWPPAQQHYAYDPQAAPFPSPYGDNSSISSRSTSVSTSTEGAGSGNSSMSEQYISSQAGPSNYGTPSLFNSAMMQSRSQSVSPNSPFVPRTQASSGNSTPGGSYAYPQSATSPPQNAPWGTVHPYYGQLNYSTPASPMDNSRNQYLMTNPYVGANGQHTPSYPRQPIQGNGAWANGAPYGTHFVPAQQMSQQDPSNMGTGHGRGRVSQGSERGLFDPNKPLKTSSSSSSSTPNNRHSLGKSVSAAAVLENGLGQQRSTSGMSTPISSRAITPSGDQIRRSSSSNTKNGHPISTGSTSSSSSISSINHPSLPARPNWVTRQSNSSQSIQSNLTESETSSAEKNANGNGTTISNTDSVVMNESKQADLHG